MSIGFLYVYEKRVIYVSTFNLMLLYFRAYFSDELHVNSVHTHIRLRRLIRNRTKTVNTVVNTLTFDRPTTDVTRFSFKIVISAVHLLKNNSDFFLCPHFTNETNNWIVQLYLYTYSNIIDQSRKTIANVYCMSNGIQYLLVQNP